jgi:hydrogenase maturation factor
MCLTAPALVLSVAGDEAFVQLPDGRRRVSRLIVPDLQLGEHCLVGLGMVLSRIDERELKATGRSPTLVGKGKRR